MLLSIVLGLVICTLVFLALYTLEMMGQRTPVHQVIDEQSTPQLSPSQRFEKTILTFGESHQTLEQEFETHAQKFRKQEEIVLK